MSPRTKEQLDIIRETKSQIIGEAALKLFASNGYQNTSIREIAIEAGVSKGLIYNYFNSKEEILSKLIDNVTETMWNRFELQNLKEITEDDYKDFLNLSIDIVLEDLNHYRLWFAVFTQPQVLTMVMEDLWEKAAPVMKLMLDYYQKKGYPNPMAQMRYASAVIDGIQMHIMLDPENFPIEEVRKILIKQLTN